LSVLEDDIDDGARGIGEVDDLLCVYVPSHCDALSLQLSDVDNGSVGFYINFFVSFCILCRKSLVPIFWCN
jgi:hypothetical protein